MRREWTKKIGIWRLWLLPALILLALFFCGPTNPAKNIEGPGLIVPAGGRVSLDTGLLPDWWQEVDLLVRCGPGMDCTALRVGDPFLKVDQPPIRGDKGEAAFRPRINNLTIPQMELINTSSQALTVSRIEWKNFAAINTGFPRFAVLINPFPGPGFSPWVTLFLSLGAALLMIVNLFLLEQRTQVRLNQGVRWVPLIFPGFILVFALVLRFKGMHLLLSWEAFLFTTFPGYLYLGLTSPIFKKRVLVPLLVFCIAATLLILLGTVLGVGLSVRNFGPPFIYHTHFTKTALYAGLSYMFFFIVLFRNKKDWFSPDQHLCLSSMLWVFFPTLIIYLANGYSDYGGDSLFNGLLSWRILQGEGLRFSKDFIAEKGSWGLLEIGDGFLPTFPMGPGFLGLPTALIQYYWSAEPVAQLIAWNQKVTAVWVAAFSAAVIFRMVYLLGRKLWLSLLLTAAFALGTCQPTISAAVLWQHGPSVLLLSLGLLFLIKGQKETPSFYPLAALPMAFLPLMRPQTFLFYVAALVAVAILQPKKIMAFLLWSIPGITATLWINLGLYHTLLGGYAYQALGDNFATPLLEGTLGLLFSPNRGVLVFSPFLILGIMGGVILCFKKRSVIAITFGVASLLFFVIHAKYGHWHGGWCVAPRFTSELVPVLMLFSVYPFLEWKKFWFRLTAVLLIVISITINLPGSFYLNEQGAWNFFPNADLYRSERVWDFKDWLPFHFRYWVRLKNYQEVPAFPFVMADEAEPLKSETLHYRVKVALAEKPLEVIRLNNVALKEGIYQIIIKGNSQNATKAVADLILGYVGYTVEEAALSIDNDPTLILFHKFHMERAGRIDIRLLVSGKGNLILDTIRIIPIGKGIPDQ